MSNKEYVAIIIVIITMICLIVIPRLYYRKKRKNFTNNPGDTTGIITAIYNASAVEVNAIYTTSVVQIGLLAGLIIAFRK
ncbi:hypothetical protein ES705_11277 [subsurface metagenome]